MSAADLLYVGKGYGTYPDTILSAATVSLGLINMSKKIERSGILLNIEPKLLSVNMLVSFNNGRKFCITTDQSVLGS